MKKIFFFLFSFFWSSYLLAIDIDDGIEIDDSIDGYHEMEKIQKNISYVIRKAISGSYSMSTEDNIFVYNGNNVAGISSVNSVIVGTGGNVEGDIVIIDQSKGDKAAVSKK